MGELIEQATKGYTKDRYATYLRKSRADLELEAMGEGETLARHKAMLDNLAAKHGISSNQITVYKEVVSGDSLDDRPEAQRLLNDVHSKHYKGVLVVEVERLARGNTRDQGEVAEAFQYSETLIITPSKVYDPNDEFDQEYFEFGLFMSRREYKTIRRRLNSGKLQSVQEGNYVPSRPPYGFDVVRKGKKDRILVERPDQSRIVKMIFDWYVNDRVSTYAIAHKLTEMRVPTSKNNTEWGRTSVREILFNAHYIGMVSWGDSSVRREKDPRTGRTIKKISVSGEPNLYPGKHKGFISEEQFWKVREIYGTKAHNTYEKVLVNPYAGLLFCADCGKAIVLNRYSGSAKAARLLHPIRMVCKKKSLPINDVTNALVETLQLMISDCKIKLDSRNGDSEMQKHAELIAAMEMELGKQQTRKRKLFESWESDDGMYTRDEFIERKNMYMQAIEDLTEKIESAKKEAPKAINYEEQIISLHAIIDCLKNDDLSAEEKNIFLKQFIKVIKYDVIDLGVKKGGKPILEIFFK